MRKWLPLAMILAAAGLSLAVYQRLPDPMPIHWDARGEPNGYGSRLVGAFLLPGILLLVWGFLRLLPTIDPRGANIEKFRDAYEVLVLAVVGVLVLVHVTVIGSTLGWPLAVGRVTPVAIGGLFLALGTLMPRFQSNFFIGIRTPWTLSSETVWTRTHRVGGYLMWVVGTLLVVAGIVGSERWFWIAIGGSMAMAIGILVYSYVLWRAEQPGRGRG